MASPSPEKTSGKGDTMHSQLANLSRGYKRTGNISSFPTHLNVGRPRCCSWPWRLPSSCRGRDSWAPSHTRPIFADGLIDPARVCALQKYGYAERDAESSYIRNIVSGYVAPVPILAAFWLFAAPISGILARKRFSNR